MSRSFLRQSTLDVCALLLAALSVANLTAQQPKVFAPHGRIPQRIPKAQEIPLPPAKLGSLVGGPWMTDPNLKSSIYLKNVLEVSPITVTPILYLSNGKRFALPDVTLEPVGTAIVDINAELQKLGIASYATLSGYVEIQYKWAWVPVCATIRVVDAAHSLIFTYGVQPSTQTDFQSQRVAARNVVEGVWWKHEDAVGGFVALANTSSNAVLANIEVNDSQGAPIASHKLTVSPHGAKIIELSELDSVTAGSSGGIHVAYTGPERALVINGGLKDTSAGYSANMRFGPAPSSSAQETQTTLAELGLMVGAADPMMLFPAGTTFAPYSVLRNISDGPMAIKPTVWWMQAGLARSTELPVLTLSPGQSRSLDVLSSIAATRLNNFNGSLNIEFDVRGKQGGLLLAAGSVDQTNTYVFEVNPRRIEESGSKSLGYWSTGNGDDTMVTLWNPADEAQDFVFRLAFSGGRYLVPMHLGPRATRTFNVSEIIQNQVPDAEGSTIPTTIHEGSATVTGIHADPEHILLAMDVGIYNVRKATCGGGCIYCDGYTTFNMSPGSASFAVRATKQYQALGTWSSGAQYSVANSWSSSHTSVATVNSSGLATGVAAGSANFSAPYGPDAVYTGETCFSNGNPYCPAPPASGTMTGTGTVQVPTSLAVLNVTVLPNGQGLNFGCSVTDSKPTRIRMAIVACTNIQPKLCICMTDLPLPPGWLWSGTGQSSVGGR